MLNGKHTAGPDAVRAGPGASCVGVLWSYGGARSGQRRLLFGQTTQTILQVNLIGASRPQLGQLSLEVPYSGAKECHLIEEPAVRSRCNITDQGLSHLKGLHGQDACVCTTRKRHTLKGGMG